VGKCGFSWFVRSGGGFFFAEVFGGFLVGLRGGEAVNRWMRRDGVVLCYIVLL